MQTGIKKTSRITAGLNHGPSFAYIIFSLRPILGSPSKLDSRVRLSEDAGYCMRRTNIPRSFCKGCDSSLWRPIFPLVSLAAQASTDMHFLASSSNGNSLGPGTPSFLQPVPSACRDAPYLRPAAKPLIEFPSVRPKCAPCAVPQ
jgi:hypothetical protein